MDEREPFLKRWSRLKGGGIPPAPGDAEALAPSADGAETDAVVSSVQQSDEPFDLAELPRVDELTADSDIRRFLDARVPAALRNAALRQAWSLDPTIRDFIEVAENQWNWNVPGGAPGYGPLEPGTDIAALLAQAIGAVPAAAPSADAPVVASREDVIEGTATACTAKEQSAAPQQAGRQDEPVVQPILPSDCEPAVVVATQHASVVEPLAGTPRHRHGGALPG